jgi:hypothetical protein
VVSCSAARSIAAYTVVVCCGVLLLFEGWLVVPVQIAPAAGVSCYLYPCLSILGIAVVNVCLTLASEVVACNHVCRLLLSLAVVVKMWFCTGNVQPLQSF